MITNPQTNTNTAKLAYYGGTSVRLEASSWPKWPLYSNDLIREFEAILESHCWSISSNYNGQKLRYEKFAKEFAAYCGTRYCIPTDHGSSAIIAALNALGIGKGDEVILPALTWVSCPISILKTGAQPILVDVEPCTQCIDPVAIEEAITPKTKALLVVHLYSCMANLDKILAIAKQHNLIVIEDCAQAHGAEWQGRKAGSLGDIGVFSFQHGKPLASGEGGAVVTSNPDVFLKVQQATMHGRIIDPDPRFGHVRLKEVGNSLGGNMALPEFQAAVLLDSLPQLDRMNEIREENARYLDEELAKIPGLLPINSYENNNKRSYYHYNIRFDESIYSGLDASLFCELLESELHTWIHPTYPPLNSHPLYKPTVYLLENASLTADFPNAEMEHKRTLLFHHSNLLGTRNDMDDIVKTFEKIYEVYSL